VFAAVAAVERVAGHASGTVSDGQAEARGFDSGPQVDYDCRALVDASFEDRRSPRLPAIAIHTDDTLLSAQILRRKLFTLLGENDLGDNASRSTPGSPNGPSEN